MVALVDASLAFVVAVEDCAAFVALVEATGFRCSSRCTLEALVAEVDALLSEVAAFDH